jgi:hypothetical protein
MFYYLVEQVQQMQEQFRKLYHLQDYFCLLKNRSTRKLLSINQIWDADTIAQPQFFLAPADHAAAQPRLHLTVSRRLATRRARVCTAVWKSGIGGHVCWNSLRRSPFIICRPRKTNFHFGLQQTNGSYRFPNIHTYIYIYIYTYTYTHTTTIQIVISFWVILFTTHEYLVRGLRAVCNSFIYT